MTDLITGGLWGLALGATLGAAGFIALDPTSFSQDDLDRAASAAAAERAEPAVDPAALTAVDDLEDTTALLERMEIIAASRKAQLDAMTKKAEGLATTTKALKKRLADATATAEAATSTLERAEKQARQAARDAVEMTGTVRATTLFASSLKPWPSDCSSAVTTYLVRVTPTGEGAAGAEPLVAGLGAPEVDTRSVTDGTLSLTCAVPYSIDLGVPSAAAYEVSVAATADPGTVLRAITAPVGEIEDGTGPDLEATFCPTC